MELDETRTVAEAMKDYAFLRLTCACGRITDYPFTLLLQRKGVSRDTFLHLCPVNKRYETLSGDQAFYRPDPIPHIANTNPLCRPDDAGYWHDVGGSRRVGQQG